MPAGGRHLSGLSAGLSRYGGQALGTGLHLTGGGADGIDDDFDGVVEGFGQMAHFGAPPGFRFQFLTFVFRLKTEPFLGILAEGDKRPRHGAYLVIPRAGRNDHIEPAIGQPGHGGRHVMEWGDHHPAECQQQKHHHGRHHAGGKRHLADQRRLQIRVDASRLQATVKKPTTRLSLPNRVGARTTK